MATIFEVLQNAKLNLVDHRHSFGDVVGREQLNNAVTLLQKGYDLNDDADLLFDEYGMLENIPHKEGDVVIDLIDN